MTIYALSTGPGISGIAVIRGSGINAADVVRKITGNKLPSQNSINMREKSWLMKV